MVTSNHVCSPLILQLIGVVKQLNGVDFCRSENVSKTSQPGTLPMYLLCLFLWTMEFGSCVFLYIKQRCFSSFGKLCSGLCVLGLHGSINMIHTVTCKTLSSFWNPTTMHWPCLAPKQLFCSKGFCSKGCKIKLHILVRFCWWSNAFPDCNFNGFWGHLTSF